MLHLDENTPGDSENFDRWSALLAAVPHLRAFARLLRADPTRADTLVQEVIILARATTRPILPGKELKIWLLTLAHSLHYRDQRKAGALYDARSGTGPPHVLAISCTEACCTSNEFSLAFSQLHDEEREALILLEAADLTYAEAAGVCSCPIEAIESRASRAREKLLQTQVDGAAQPPERRPH